MQKDFLSKADQVELEIKHKLCKDRRQADRIKTILGLDRGYGFEDLAMILLLDDGTLRRYYKEYLQGGVKLLLEDNYRGGSSKLDKDELLALDLHLEQNTYPSSKGIVFYIKETFNISYTSEGVKALLHRLGYSYKKSKHKPSKADIVLQQEFIGTYEILKDIKQPQDKIYFTDACHPLHNSLTAYGWIKKGRDKFIPSNSGRDRLNINGAYNIEDQSAVVQHSITINADSVIELFTEIENKQEQGSIYIICDNAKYYKSNKVKAFLEKHQRICLVFLPPYSPNLNVIERLWKFFKKKCLANTFYPSFKDFQKMCMDFFKNLHLYKTELSSLLTDNFQLWTN